jgi:REP element-mobilizing transposase RayT
MKALAIGGTSDHLHTLISPAGNDERRKSSSVTKGGSSKWVHDSTAGYQKFSWQEGYGAFSVSASQKDKTIAYIRGQKEHHRRRTFQEEFLEFLNKHGVEDDPQYVF